MRITEFMHNILQNLLLHRYRKATCIRFLSCLSLVTLSVCLIPVALNWHLDVEQNDDQSLPLAASSQSEEFHTSIVASLSISIPLLIELITRPMMIPKSSLFDKVIFSNFVILCSLAIPDLLTLFYAMPYHDLHILNFILRARMVVVVWSSFTVILIYGGGFIWGQGSSMLCQAFVCGSRVIGNFRPHYVGLTHKALLYSGFTFDALAFIIFISLAYKWLAFVYKESKQLKTQSADRYLCSVNVVGLLVCWAGAIITFYMNPNSVEWSTSDSTKLTSHTLMYTVYYVLILVFEGKVLTREMLLAKVSLYH